MSNTIHHNLREATAPEGVPQQWADTPPAGLSPEFTAFYRDAIDAGYIEYPIGGPWGRQVFNAPDGTRLKNDPMTGQCWHSGERFEGDWSVILRKDDVYINLVDRSIARRDGSVMVHHEIQGWFRNGKQAFALDAPSVFDEGVIESIRRTCNECKQSVADASELKRAGFAGWYCQNCFPVMQPKLEFRGWDS